MSDVNITDLRQNLPAYLERARRGERIRVTSRGQVIAEIALLKATQQEAQTIRSQLRGSLVHYELPMDSAFDPKEWSANQ